MLNLKNETDIAYAAPESASRASKLALIAFATVWLIPIWMVGISSLDPSLDPDPGYPTSGVLGSAIFVIVPSLLPAVLGGISIKLLRRTGGRLRDWVMAWLAIAMSLAFVAAFIAMLV